MNTSNVLAIIMGGGQGTRLFPLTKERSKPAVPLAGKYRLVDIPLSNCINSDFRRIYVLTQFNSTSLHRHISQSYKFDNFTDGFVEVLAAQQTFDQGGWYQGTADAVRQNFRHVFSHDWDYIVILSGDQLYRMDFRHMLRQHIETYADITIATLPVPRDQAKALGILQINEERRIVRFAEKPKEDQILNSLKIEDAMVSHLGIAGSGDMFLASMGIYIFNRKVLKQALDNELTDFGRDIIPAAMKSYRVFGYVFQGYWEDIGTIRSFFEANLDLVSTLPKFNFFDADSPIFTHPRFLPGSKINSSTLRNAIVSDGCIINDANIENSIIGLRSVIESGTVLKNVVVMGADSYELESHRLINNAHGIPHLGIGAHCRIENAIIDKNARIGNGTSITSKMGSPDKDGEFFYVRDGIVVIPKNACVPPETKI